MIKYLPDIMLLTAINLFIAVKTDLLADTYFTVVVFLAVNAIFLLAVQMIAYLNKDANRLEYLWRDAEKALPKEASYVKVVVKHKGTLHICDAFYDMDLYGKYDGWGVSDRLFGANTEVILWRYRTFEEMREY
ncbi:MAG: hypothetical protein Q4B81_04175 [Moraxella sp.]|nr:hypothetical protein [Moraxella sp.]